MSISNQSWKALEALEGQASRCDLFLVEAWREGGSRGENFLESMDRALNVRQFTVGLWWSCEFVRRASGYGLETRRLLGGL